MKRSIGKTTYILLDQLKTSLYLKSALTFTFSAWHSPSYYFVTYSQDFLHVGKAKFKIKMSSVWWSHYLPTWNLFKKCMRSKLAIAGKWKGQCLWLFAYRPYLTHYKLWKEKNILEYISLSSLLINVAMGDSNILFCISFHAMKRKNPASLGEEKEPTFNK